MQYRNRLVLTLLIVISLLIIINLFVNKGLQIYYKATYEKFSEMFCDSSKYDVLLLGSSRVHRNLDTRICDSITGLSFYNGGISGANAFEVYTAFEGYLENHPDPKYVILGYDLGIMSKTERLYNPIFYLNFLQNRKIFNSFSKIDKFTPYYNILPFLRLIHLNDDLRAEAVKGLMHRQSPFDYNYKGFSRIGNRRGRFSESTKMKDSIKADINNNVFLNGIVDLCKRRNIHLIFFSGPVFNHFYERTYPDYKSEMENSINYAGEHNIAFLSFDTLSINTHKEYFIDDIHLNESGTEKFSIILADVLSNQFRQQENSLVIK